MEQYLSAIGQDSHRFVDETCREMDQRKLVLAGVHIREPEILEGNSDADVVFHALTNAISGISCVNVLGSIADKMCQEGNTNSQAYLEYALNTLHSDQIVHVSISVECLKPKLSGYINAMRRNIASVIGIGEEHVGFTATSGEGLTEVGRGMGISVICIVTVRRIVYE